MNPRRALATLLLGLAAAPWAAAARAQAPDPFAPHLRWRHEATASTAWLPSSVAFGAGGELAWSAAVGSQPHAMLFGSGALPAAPALAPLRQDAAYAGASGAILVAAGADSEALFSLAQYPVAGPLQRRTEVACYAPEALPFAPHWRHSLALVGNGAARLAAARDGTRVVAAVHDSASSTLAVEWLAGTSGAPLASTSLSSAPLRELAASSDLARTALLAGAHVWLLDGVGATVFEQDLGLATNALALAGDGRTLAFGFGPRVRVVREQSGAYQLASDVWGAFGELPIRAALSNDGDTLAIAWWDQVSGTSVRLQVWRAGALAFEHVESTPGSYQNYPTAVQLTPDGARALFAAWGHPSAASELWLVDVDAGALAWALDLPGSALAAALDESGTRLLVGAKHAHANQFGSTGEVRLYDTGARDLQVIGTPAIGSGIHLAARRAGANRAFFVLGQRLAVPIPFKSGVLSIDRAHGGRIFVRPANASGRADLVLPLPFATLGLDFSAQAAFRDDGQLQLGATVVTPVVF